MAVLFFKFLTMLSNFALLMLLGRVMVQYRNLHYDNKSWASIFHITSLVWLIMRCSFWICTMTPSMYWNNFSFYLLYWIPTMFEFSSFMVLPLYFAQVLYVKQWNLYYEKVRPWYFGSIVAIVVFEIIWSYWIDVAEASSTICDEGPHPEDCFHTENSSTNSFRLITFICFSFLSAIQYGFGVKILQIDDQTYKRVLSLPRETMEKVNAVLVASFATRAIYQLFAMNTFYILPDIALEASQGDIPFSIFLATEFWIYLPTTLIISTITSRSFGSPASLHDQIPAPLNSYFHGYGSLHVSEGLIEDADDEDHDDTGIQLSAINADQEDEAEIIRESVDRFNPNNPVHIPQRDKSFRKQSSNMIPITFPPPKESALYGNSWVSSKTPSFHSVSTGSNNSYNTHHYSQFGSAGAAVGSGTGSVGGTASSFGNTPGSNQGSHQEVTLYSSYMKHHHSSSHSSRQDLLPPLHMNSASGSCPEPGSSLSGKLGGTGIAAGSSVTSQGSGGAHSFGTGSYLSKGLSPHRPIRFYNQASTSNHTSNASSNSVDHHQGAEKANSECGSPPLPSSQSQSPLVEDRKSIRAMSYDASFPPFPMTEDQGVHTSATTTATTLTTTIPTSEISPKLQIETVFPDEDYHLHQQGRQNQLVLADPLANMKDSPPSQVDEVEEEDDYELQVEPRSPTPLPLNVSGLSSSGSKSSNSTTSLGSHGSVRKYYHTNSHNTSIDLNTSLSTILSTSQSSLNNNNKYVPQVVHTMPMTVSGAGSSGTSSSIESSGGAVGGGSSQSISNISIYFSPPVINFQPQAQQQPHDDPENHPSSYPPMEEGRFYMGSFNPLVSAQQQMLQHQQQQQAQAHAHAMLQTSEESSLEDRQLHHHLVEIHTEDVQGGTRVMVRNTYSPHALSPHSQMLQVPVTTVTTHTVVPKPTRTMRNRPMSGYELPLSRNVHTSSSDGVSQSDQLINGSNHHQSAGSAAGSNGGSNGGSNLASPTQFSQVSYSWSPSPVFALYTSPFSGGGGSQQSSTPNMGSGTGSARPHLLSSSFTTSSPMFNIISSSPHSSNTSSVLYHHNNLTRSTSVGPGFGHSMTPERREAAADTRRLRESLNQMRPTPPQFSPEDSMLNAMHSNMNMNVHQTSPN